MIKAVIFDHDGVIVNTEYLISKAWEYIIRKHNKKPILTEEGLFHTQGLKARDNWKQLREKYGIEDSDFELSFQDRTNYYLKLLEKNAKPVPGLLILLKILKKENIKMAIASNALKIAIDTVVKHLKIKDFFNIIVNAENLKRGKPFPDIFLLAAEKLKVSPKDCLVIEDTAIGVEAAKNAGMKAIAVPTIYTKNQDFSKADLIVNSLKEIKWSTIQNIW